MSKHKVIGLGSTLALVLGIQSACAQVFPVSGMYQVVSGRYVACCGIGGPFISPLPDAGDAFIELSVDPTNFTAQMRVLGQDMQTVLLSPRQPCDIRFPYVFTNGFRWGIQIRFLKASDPAEPLEPYYSFSITNSGGVLTLRGSVTTPCPPSSDAPLEFEHDNVVAVLMPVPSVRVSQSQAEVCWNAVTNVMYQVQYQSTLTTNAWVDLGAPVGGNGSTHCITDNLPADQPQRFYRVLIRP